MFTIHVAPCINNIRRKNFTKNFVIETNERIEAMIIEFRYFQLNYHSFPLHCSSTTYNAKQILIRFGICARICKSSFSSVVRSAILDLFASVVAHFFLCSPSPVFANWIIQFRMVAGSAFCFYFFSISKVLRFRLSTRIEWTNEEEGHLLSLLDNIS